VFVGGGGREDNGSEGAKDEDGALRGKHVVF